MNNNTANGATNRPATLNNEDIPDASVFTDAATTATATATSVTAATDDAAAAAVPSPFSLMPISYHRG